MTRVDPSADISGGTFDSDAPSLSPHSPHTKSRYIWNPRAWQLLRERPNSRYARSAVPRQVKGVRIEFADSKLSLGLRIRATSTHLTGENLLEMLYCPQKRDAALSMALIALQALYEANIHGTPFPLFSCAYRLFRNWKILLREAVGRRILTQEQRATIRGLFAQERRGRNRQRVLVHGDLHATNVLINLAVPSLAFLDLELMHEGSPATDFAPLWLGFYFADPHLGMTFRQQYVETFPDKIDDQFDISFRAEVARRCYAMIRTGQKLCHARMVTLSHTLLENTLTARTWEDIGNMEGNYAHQ